MASIALQPRCVPANPQHDRFDLALRRYADVAARQANLPASRTMTQDLAAAEACEREMAKLIATRAPDVETLGIKLQMVLRAADVSPVIMHAIAADVRNLTAREARS